MPPAQALLDRLRRCLAGEPEGDADDPLALGAELHGAGQLEAALAAFELAARRDPGRVAAWQAVATLRFSLGRHPGALAACDAALALAPGDADCRFNRAAALDALGDGAAALAGYAATLDAAPGHFGALLNLIPLLLRQGETEAARAAAREAIAHHPQAGDCWFNLGEALMSAGDYRQALAAYAKAGELDPESGKAQVAIAVAEAACGDLAAAEARFQHLRRQRPEALAAFRSPLVTDQGAAFPEIEAGRIALIAAYRGYRHCDWSAREDFVRLYHRVVAGDGCRPLDNPDLLFLGLGLQLPPEVRLQAARQVAARVVASLGGTRLIPAPRTSRPRIRIAYLSGDFRRHPMAYLVAPLIEGHDRQRFEVFAYGTGPDDGSPERQRIAKGADVFRDLARLPAAALAQRIARDEIDLLVDLSAHMLHGRSAALALRPAPLQVAYLAYLSTLGAPWIDYAILDRQVLTAAERPAWDERICYLPQTLMICDDRPRALPAVSRAAAGLPADRLVFASLNAPWKIDPATFTAWVRILRAVPTSLLWIYADSPAAAANLRAAATAAGLGSERLAIAGPVPHAQHLARFALADVFLDTFACNGHTTCVEALEAGLPVVTLAGEQVVARVGASLLRAQGLPELVAATVDDYVAIATRLATDRTWREAIRHRLAERPADGLFATHRRVREIERAYELMWSRHRAGLPPADVDVPPGD